MASGKVMLLSVVAFAALVAARPQNSQEPSWDLPFLQFKDGGIGVNFAGYHANAGLGGLLSDSRTRGGLYASAGTPSGAHASAGLGGLLDDNGTDGGLHARAGLGNGGPEAGAGLGGILDSNPESPARGGLYAAATPGNLSTKKRVMVRRDVLLTPRSEVKEMETAKVTEIGSGANPAGSAAKSGAKETEKEVGAQPMVSTGIAGGLHVPGEGATRGRSFELM